MKVHFVQSGFKDLGGHYLLETRAWHEAVSHAGLAWRGYANARLAPALASAAEVVPLFPYEPLAQIDPDPLSRETTDLLYLSEQFASAALLMAHVEPEDLVIVEFATEREIYGLARWLRQIDAKRRPHVACIVHVPDAQFRTDARRATFSGRATNWRFAINQLKVSLPLSRLSVSATDARLAQLLGTALDLQTMVTPLVSWFDQDRLQNPATPDFDLLFAGDSRFDKGSNMVLDIVKALAQVPRPLRIGIQVADETRRTLLRQTVPERPDLSLDIVVGAVDVNTYIGRLTSTRLMVLPYMAEHYAMRGSGVAAEAFGYGIPVVAPNHTWISDRLAEGAGAGVLFEQLHPDQIAAACCVALDRHQDLSSAARARAPLWRSSNSAAVALSRLRLQLHI